MCLIDEVVWFFGGVVFVEIVVLLVFKMFEFGVVVLMDDMINFLLFFGVVFGVGVEFCVEDVEYIEVIGLVWLYVEEVIVDCIL